MLLKLCFMFTVAVVAGITYGIYLAVMHYDAHPTTPVGPYHNSTSNSTLLSLMTNISFMTSDKSLSQEDVSKLVYRTSRK